MLLCTTLLVRSHIPDLMRKCNSQWKKTCDCISDKSNCCPAIEVEWRVNELRLLAFLAVVSVRLSVKKKKKASLGRHYLHSTSRILSLALPLSTSIGHKRHLNTEAKTSFICVFSSHLKKYAATTRKAATELVCEVHT